MIGLIFFIDGKFDKGVPIMNSDEEGYPTTMVTFKNIEETRAFAWAHPLSAYSHILAIDFESDEMIWL